MLRLSQFKLSIESDTERQTSIYYKTRFVRDNIDKNIYIIIIKNDYIYKLNSISVKRCIRNLSFILSAVMADDVCNTHNRMNE